MSSRGSVGAGLGFPVLPAAFVAGFRRRPTLVLQPRGVARDLPAARGESGWMKEDPLCSD